MTPFLDELAARAAHIMVNNLEAPPPHLHHRRHLPPPKKSGVRAAWRLHLDTSSLIAATDAHKNTESPCCRGSSSETTRVDAISPRREEDNTLGETRLQMSHLKMCNLFFFFFFEPPEPCCHPAVHRLWTGFFWHLLYYGWEEETHRPWMRLKIILPRLLAEIGFYPTQMSTL